MNLWSHEKREWAQKKLEKRDNDADYPRRFA